MCVSAASYLAVDMNAACDSVRVCVESHLQRSASSCQLHSQELALANVPSVLFEAYEAVHLCFFQCRMLYLIVSLHVCFFLGGFFLLICCFTFLLYCTLSYHGRD